MKNKTSIYALFSAHAISLVGNVMAAIAIPWFVLESGGSAAQVGLVAFFTALPTVAATLVGGTLADRFGHKRMSVVSDLLSFIAVALIPLCYLTIGLEFWQLLLFVFMGALFDAPGHTGRVAIVPDLAATTHMPLERASSLMDGCTRIAGLVGAPLAGILISFIGIHNVLWINAGTFIISAFLIAIFVPRPKITSTSTQDQPKQHIFTDMLEGMRFIVQQKVVIALITTILITNFLDAALLSVIYPVYVKQFFDDPLVLGMMIASFGISALIGTVLFGAVGHRYSRRLLLIVGLMIASLRFGMMAFTPSLPLIIVVHILAGLAIGPVNPIMYTFGYERIPPELRARVFGTITASMLIANPLAVLITGYLLEWFTITSVLWVMGGCYLLAASALLLNRSMKEIDISSTQVVPAN